METMKLQKQVTASTMLDPKILVPAIRSAFVKLDPRLMMKNPVMFVVEVVAALTTVIFVRDLVTGNANLGFTFQIILWLWFTVLFANFAEAVAEGRGKAQAAPAKKDSNLSRNKGAHSPAPSLARASPLTPACDASPQAWSSRRSQTR